jgi:sn-glycerol 3-phosphate transport system ATP-binding protein
MNAGRVEQAGNPLDIYEKPASTFVASFIGAPPMNLLKLAQNGDGLALADGARLGAAPQAAMTLGFRPEDASVAGADGSGNGGLSLAATVEGVEPVGAESFLYCAAAGGRVVVRVGGRAIAKPGDRLNIVARPDKLHWFDRDGRRVD